MSKTAKTLLQMVFACDFGLLALIVFNNMIQ